MLTTFFANLSTIFNSDSLSQPMDQLRNGNAIFSRCPITRNLIDRISFDFVPFFHSTFMPLFLYTRDAISDTGYSSSTCSYLSLYNTITILKCQEAVSFWHALLYGVTNI